MAILEWTVQAVRHRPREHAAARTPEYLFCQLIPYIGNKRRLLPMISRGVLLTGCRGGTFVDLFAGSTVVARLAKGMGFRVLANDWEPYAYHIAAGTVAPNAVPPFADLGGAGRVFDALNSLPPLAGYVTRHLCPGDDERPDLENERMFFTRANGQRIDAMREQIAAWEAAGLLSPAEKSFLLSALLYSVSYVSNTSGVFKGFHRGWGGTTGTALYRIRSLLRVRPPVLLDNGQENLAACQNAQELGGRLKELLGRTPDIVYLDPPYNQHPYGSNYHVLNTVVLWDKPPLAPTVRAPDGRRDKSAIRKDWRTQRRSPYNYARSAPRALEDLINSLQARWVLASYSTDGIIPAERLLGALAGRGDIQVLTQRYKRYRVSTPRMSPRPHNLEYLVVLDAHARPAPAKGRELAERILKEQGQALPE
jgi:adenine-specific DNA-methyltransferase